jgi:hypothetical protein
MRFGPRVPLADLDGQGHFEMPDVLHRFRDPWEHFFYGVFGDLEEQFIMDLQQHMARQVLGGNLVVQVYHRQFDQICG